MTIQTIQIAMSLSPMTRIAMATIPTSPIQMIRIAMSLSPMTRIATKKVLRRPTGRREVPAPRR